MAALLIAAGVFLTDQALKYLVMRNLGPGESIPVIPGLLDITFIRNPGAAFGILPNQSFFFVIVTLVVLGVIGYFITKNTRLEPLLLVSFGFTLGGAVGNLADRLRHGSVTDFIDFRFWPVFNVADIAIVLGAFMMAWSLLTQRDPAGRGAGDGPKA